MKTRHQKRLTMLQSKRKSSVQQSAMSSAPQPLVVEIVRDWLQLLIVPLVLALIGIGFTWRQDQTSLQIADDQQKEATLKGYLDDMSDLLLNHSLRNSRPTDEVRQVARERTLTTLRRLNADRNMIVLQFLQDARLIGWKASIIDLRTQETARSSPSWRSGVEKTGNSQRTTFGVMGVA